MQKMFLQESLHLIPDEQYYTVEMSVKAACIYFQSYLEVGIMISQWFLLKIIEEETEQNLPPIYTSISLLLP